MIYVFEIRVKPGYTAEQYASAWVAASEIIQRAPGARGTRLHRCLDDPSRLIAIASWDSKADRDRADALDDETVREIILSQADYVEIDVIGEFDDPDWIVMPQD